MWARGAPDVDHRRGTPLNTKWITLALMMCMYSGCIVLYISVANTSMQVAKYARTLLLEIEHMKEMEDSTLEYISRLARQQEQRILKQNALIQNLMSQSEVIFYDLEIISQVYERTQSMTGLVNNVTSFDWMSTLSELSYSTETARRRTENIVTELWYFLHDQLKDLGKTIEAKTLEDGDEIVHLRQAMNPQDVQKTSPQDVQKITNPQDVQNPMNPQDVQKTMNPQDVQKTMHSQDVQNPMNPQDVQNPMNPRDVQKTKNPQDVQNPIDPQRVQNPMNPQDVQNPINPQDVQKTMNPQEVQNPMKPQDIQNPINPQDVQNPMNPRGVQKTMTQQDVQKTMKQHDVQSPMNPQDVQKTTNPQDVQNPMNPQDVQNPMNPQDVQTAQDVSRFPASSLLPDSKTYVEEQDLNKTRARESESLSRAEADEQIQIATSAGSSGPDANYSTERNDLNSRDNVIKRWLQTINQELLGYRRALTDAFTTLRNADYSENVRQLMSRDLGSLVQQRLDYIQNPKDCGAAQKIACGTKPCGFGCNFHHFIYCLISAYSMNKTLLLYAPESWSTLFDPPSKTCDVSRVNLATGFTTADEYLDNSQPQNTSAHTGVFNSQVNPVFENLPIIEDLLEHNRGHIPLSVPKDLAPKLAIFHGNPAAWWVGQVATYLFKPSSVLMGHIKLLQRKLGFRKPIVGVHVRRTDKLTAEASYHSLEEYMLHVEDYYDQLQRSMPEVVRRVFLATDDSSLLSEAEETYPNYTFLSDVNASKVTIEEREHVNAVRGIAADIYFLSRSDFLVCTFSSQVCRLAYEMMQTLHGDASGRFRSLDDIYYFGGQQTHHVVAVESYHAGPDRIGMISLEKGDKISVAGNHWNGFSKGSNERTSKTGLYPSYAVEDTVASFPMPVYSAVH